MSSDEPDRSFTMVDANEGAGPAGERPGGGDAAIDFSTFVLSLGASAIYQMGQLPDPETGAARSEPNLPAARQTIDTLEMLRAKTRGNLDADEAKLLESILYELQMKFVEISR
jgi:hypothetical protein